MSHLSKNSVEGPGRFPASRPMGLFSDGCLRPVGVRDLPLWGLIGAWRICPICPVMCFRVRGVSVLLGVRWRDRKGLTGAACREEAPICEEVCIDGSGSDRRGPSRNGSRESDRRAGLDDNGGSSSVVGRWRSQSATWSMIMSTRCMSRASISVASRAVSDEVFIVVLN